MKKYNLMVNKDQEKNEVVIFDAISDRTVCKFETESWGLKTFEEKVKLAELLCNLYDQFVFNLEQLIEE